MRVTPRLNTIGYASSLSSSSSSTTSSSSSILQPRGSLVHHRRFHNQFPPFCPLLKCPPELGELQACPLPVVVFQPLPLPALSSFSFHCALQYGFGQTWWTEDMYISLQFVSFTMVRRSSCGSTACRILAQTSSLVRQPATRTYYPANHKRLYQGK